MPHFPVLHFQRPRHTFKRRPWRHFTQKSATTRWVNTKRLSGARAGQTRHGRLSVPRTSWRTLVRQLMIYSTFVLVVLRCTQYILILRDIQLSGSYGADVYCRWERKRWTTLRCLSRWRLSGRYSIVMMTPRRRWSRSSSTHWRKSLRTKWRSELVIQRAGPSSTSLLSSQLHTVGKIYDSCCAFVTLLRRTSNNV